MVQLVVIGSGFYGFALSKEAVIRLGELGYEPAVHEFKTREAEYNEELNRIIRGETYRLANNKKTLLHVMRLQDNGDWSGGIGCTPPTGISRNDPRLIQVVTEMGRRAYPKEYRKRHSTDYLKIVKVPDGVKWVIDSHDEYGGEWVAEVHRTWR